MSDCKSSPDFLRFIARKKFEEAKAASTKKRVEEEMLRAHGRLILGYCNCCGSIKELDGTNIHDKECIHYEET